jgi:hypothetical protein
VLGRRRDSNFDIRQSGRGCYAGFPDLTFWSRHLAYPAIAQVNTMSALFRAYRATQASMLISVVMNIIHIGLNALCIFSISDGCCPVRHSVIDFQGIWPS